MRIYRKDTEVLDVELKKTSYTLEEISGQHIANVEFDIRNPVEFTIDDEIKILGERYYIRHKESIEKKESLIGYEYRIQFYHLTYKLFQKAFFPHGKPEFKPNMNFLRANARMIIEVAVKCMNTGIEAGWVVGEVPETKEFNFDYKDKSVGEVLNDAAKEFGLEMWVDGQSLNIGKREYSSNGLILSQGEGFTSLRVEAVDDSPPITRLYAYGGDTNMGGEYVQLPGDIPYLEKNVEKYGVIEQIKQFEKIFPDPQFTITEKIDTHTFRSDIDFNLTDHLIENVEVLITFQTGPLGGYEFAVVEGSWDNSTKQLKLKDHTDEKDSNLLKDIHFEVGNTFVVTNIKAPQKYKDNSSKDLLEEAQKDLDSKCENRVQLRGECDEIEFAARGIFIACGQMVGVYDQKIGINREIRAIQVKRYIENNDETPYRYEITLSDFLSGNGFKEIVDAIKEVPKKIEDKVKPIDGFTKRTYQDVQETKRMMYDPESQFWQDVTSSIVGEFGHLIVGFQSAQMDFVEVVFQPNYNNNHNNFRNTAGLLVHNTITGDDKTRTWNIAASNLSLNNNNAYYIYAKCPIEGNNGTIIASATQIKLKEVPGFYHFWVGVLNTPRTDTGVTTRSWKPMYGFTEISGSDIVTGVIRDRLSRLVIDLQNASIIAQNGAKITGAITFQSGSSGYDNITDKPDLSLYATTNFVNNVTSGLEKQIDGKVETWFQPTNPWNSWAGGTEHRHVGDLWYDTSNKVLYRYIGPNTNNWGRVEDKDVIKAMQDASIAKDTADGKRRVFLATPYPPYDAGDLWTNGTNLYRCITSRQTGSYYPNDWGLATNYDNTKVVIDNGIVTAGTIQLAGDAGAIMAGMTGNGTASGSIRIWAGATYENRATAPYRVRQDGGVVMDDATVTGTINAKGGTIGGFTIKQFSLESGGLILTGGQISFSKNRGVEVFMGGVDVATGTQLAAAFTNDLNSGGTRENGTVLSLSVGRSASSSAPQNWINCGHTAGWGSKFLVESRYFNDANQMERTVVNVGALMSHAQLESMTSGNHEYYPVYYDNITGYLCFRY